MEECITASDVVKSVTILHAIRWITQVWSKVKPDVSKKCFQKGRYILDQSVQVVSREVPTEDPLLDLDKDEDVLVEDEEVQDLITQLAIENPCTVNELALADDDLADFSDEQWEDFLARSHALKTQVKTVMRTQNLRKKLICHLNFKTSRGYIFMS